jgi:hypothetical protein
MRLLKSRVLPRGSILDDLQPVLALQRLPPCVAELLLHAHDLSAHVGQLRLHALLDLAPPRVLRVLLREVGTELVQLLLQPLPRGDAAGLVALLRLEVGGERIDLRAEGAGLLGGTRLLGPRRIQSGFELVDLFLLPLDHARVFRSRTRHLGQLLLQLPRFLLQTVDLALVEIAAHRMSVG